MTGYFPVALAIFASILVSNFGDLRIAMAEDDFFQAKIAPIFRSKCVSCHNGESLKGGLSLQSRRQALQGGESGEVVLPGDADSSYLLELVTPHDGRAEMPRGDKPLSGEEIAALRRWIDQGAVWPEDQQLDPPGWWSLQPLRSVKAPTLSASQQAWAKTPIDAFIAAKHAELGLRPARTADRRTLIRRLYFDLIGLPPTPEEIEAFVADPDHDAYRRLVDRLLASPHYGERWARHWLDLVHYGETHGYDKDKPRPNAWPYRDYVIRSLNQDKPYARFVQEQIAGDILYPETADGIEALGFLAAGPWDFIGHVEVPESKIDGKIARHADRDDMVQNTMMTFNSLTVGCAQCHDHKFDPISQSDYYSLQAVFAALDRVDKSYFRDPNIQRRWAQLTQRRDQLAKEEKAMQDKFRQLAGPELASLDQQLEKLQTARIDTFPSHGYHSQIHATPERTEWVQIDLGAPHSIAGIEYVASYDDFNQIGAGFGFPKRFKIELSNDPLFQSDVELIVDHTAADASNPKSSPQFAEVSNISARFVRFTATRLAERSKDYIFALAELRVLDPTGTNLAFDKPVSSLTSIEAPVRWSRQNLVNEVYPLVEAGARTERELKTRRRELLARSV
ncbi:MAG: DUF1549 domain-containing protein, partial [Blastopirellula sp. JB062]